jgi:hypothetical protein
MLTAAVMIGLTWAVMTFDVAGLPVAQVAEEVTTHETISPLFNEALLNDMAVTPFGVPFTSHW